MLPRRLYQQVLLLLALGLVATVALFGWWMGRRQGQALLDSMKESARVLGRAHADSAARFLVIDEYAGLEGLLLDVARLPGVVRVHLHEPGGNVVVNVVRDPRGGPPRVVYEPTGDPLPGGGAPVIVEAGDRIDVWTPVEGGRLLGWLETSYDLDQVRAMQGSVWRQTALLGFLWFGVAILVVSLVLRRPMGAIRELSLFARDLPRRKGERVRVRGMANEIGLLADALDHASVELAETERQHRELEGQLRQAQKMEAIGHLAGGIAHDFNNVLTGILGYGAVLLERAGEDAELREAAQEVINAATRAATLTRGLLAFSRKQKLDPRPVDLNDVIPGVERMLRRIIGEEVELRTRLCAGRLVVHADPAALEQVLVNLATNARDAMPKGGLLEIATHLQRAGAPPAGGTVPGIAVPAAVLTVADSGVGMDDVTLQKVFEPFFTTKAPGKGTGLGLAIVHGIVQQHGGSIQVESRPAAGTTFSILLPLAEGAAVPRAEAPSAPASGGSERILLVEDEPDVRRVVTRILEGAGYRVAQAPGGEEAVALLADEGEPFALVVSDVIMPRMNGRELQISARARRPGLRFLFISGYTADVIQHRGLLAEGEDLLMKPFTAAELLARVRELLDRG